MKVTFILADTHCTYLSVVHENEHRPYRRRTVTIELTPEQAALLAPRVVGVNGGKDVHEELLTCFVESDGPAR